MNHYRLQPLRTAIKPFRLYFFTRLRSTNDHAAKLRRERKLYCPAVVVAGSQSAGRGRGSNTWWSGAGSMTATFAIPTDSGILPHHIPLIAGLAVHRALSEIAPSASLKLKWPNDLLHDDLKIAGLLCERIDGADLIGIGLNVNVDLDDIPHSLRHRVTSLRAIVGKQVPVQEALTGISKQIDSLLLRKDFASFGSLLREYDNVHALNGRSIRVTDHGNSLQGTCDGLDPQGRLLLRTRSGVEKIVAGHVELL